MTSGPASTIAGEVLDWLRAELPAAWVAAAEAGDGQALMHARAGADHAAWRRAVGASGWATPAWPIEYGGRELGPDEAAAVLAVLDRYLVFPDADFVGRTLAGPTILQWGTDAQKSRFLRPIARGEEQWCQLFSEPGAGSDLAGLATRARREGDTWTVDGQKVWTSAADSAQFGLLMARTDPGAPKHKGITCLIVDMLAQGVEVRPLREMTGLAHFNEVFLAAVQVPDRHRLGPVNDGWRVSVSTLATERSALSGGAGAGRSRVAALIDRAAARGAGVDPYRRDRLARLHAEERALQMTNGRIAAARAAGRRPGGEASTTKLLQSQLVQRVARAVVDLTGPAGAAWTAGDSDTATIMQTLLYSPAHTIAGGTSEIQRNIIGERVLGLPREPDATRDMPWKEIPRDGAR